MDANSEELKKDLEEQYAILEQEEKEDKNKRRFLGILLVFLFLFLVMFGSTYSYVKLYNGNNSQVEDILLKDLNLEGNDDAIDFSPSVYKYVVDVPYGTKKVDFNYILGNPNCRVFVEGNETLKSGINTVIIKVEDSRTGKTVEYTIYVYVDEKAPTKPAANEENLKDLSMIDLKVSDHSLDKTFDSRLSSYIVNDIKETEDSIIVTFKLKDNSINKKLFLNDYKIDRVIIENEDGSYSIKLNVKTELTLGTNKLEFVLSDDEGNENIYYLFLVVNQVEKEPEVIEITVDYGNDNGKYEINGIVPGWKSDVPQEVVITNTSNYDSYVDINWTDVLNEFEIKSDLVYSLYKNNALLIQGKLPSKDELLIKNLLIPANSKNKYIINYEYVYSDEDQNIDQGKTFKAVLKVSLSK